MSDEPNQLHFDGWQNVLTALGTSKDKRMSATVSWTNINPTVLEDFYAGDEIATRIVDLIPEESLRKWLKFTGDDKEKNIEKERICSLLDLRKAVEQTWKWARLYGGGLLYMATDSGDPSQPMQPDEKVVGLQDLSRYDVRTFSTDVEADFKSPNWGYPNMYHLQVQIGSEYKGYPIHWTRLVRFDGEVLPRRTYIRNNYWHDSTLQRLFNVIRNYQTAHDSAASILQDFNIGVFKLKGLANLLASGQEELVKRRIQTINLGKSAIRAMILDDDEEYIDVQRQVGGLADLLRMQGHRLVAATDIPHTKLLGESPDGSNATGNSTTQQWYDFVQSEQNNYLRPKLNRLFQAVFKEDCEYEFNPLWQLDEKEEVQKRNTQAQTDALYIQHGVLDPTEVADSRFGGDQYSVETQLDKDSRDQGQITGFEPGEEGMAQPDLPFGQLEESTSPGGTQQLNNTTIPSKVKKQEPVISTTMSEPFSDPRTDQQPLEVSTIEVLADGKILMGKRRDNGKWTMPGGGLEGGETPIEAAFRELKEETGMEPGPHSMQHMSSRIVKGSKGEDVHVHHFRVNLSGLGMTADGLDDPDEEVENWKFFPIKSIPEAVLKNLHSKNNVILQHHGIQSRLDAGESAFFPRQLHFFKGQSHGKEEDQT